MLCSERNARVRVCVCVCIHVHVYVAQQHLGFQTLKHTLHLCSPPLCPSSPLKHQIHYIILSIGPIEFPLPLLTELVLGEPAGNEGPALLELHFCCSFYFPQFSHHFVANRISQSALLRAPALSPFNESLLFAMTTAVAVPSCHDLTTFKSLTIKLKGCGQHRFPALSLASVVGQHLSVLRSLPAVVSSILIKP